MLKYQSTHLREDLRLEIYDLYMFKNWTKKGVKSYFDQKDSEPELKLSENQWQDLLKQQDFVKNVYEKEAVYIQSRLSQGLGPGFSLVLTGGILIDPREVQRHLGRKRITVNEPQTPKRRIFTFIPLPFSFDALSQPDDFKNFQRLLFHACVHFESSFDRGTWGPDERGLYGRSADLRVDLTALSKLHNDIVAALNRFKEGRGSDGWNLVQNTYEFHRAIVYNHHHRQIPDLVAILLLLQREGRSDIREEIMRSLITLAQGGLLQNDPRRIMFETLMEITLDSTGHSYLAIDACCRHLWRSRTGKDIIKSYYSYNQASFPRADAGEFYDFFKGKDLRQIEHVLELVDEELGCYSHETFCLWHTAIRYLGWNSKYQDMENLIDRLRHRVDSLDPNFDYTGSEFDHRWNTSPRQLNHDATVTYYLLAEAQEAQTQDDQALLDVAINLGLAVIIRSKCVPPGEWNPGMNAPLEKLESVARRLGNHEQAGACKYLIEMMYTGLEAKRQMDEYQIEQLESILAAYQPQGAYYETGNITGLALG